MTTPIFCLLRPAPPRKKHWGEKEKNSSASIIMTRINVANVISFSLPQPHLLCFVVNFWKLAFVCRKTQVKWFKDFDFCMLVSLKREGCPLCRIRSIRDDSVRAWNLRATLMTVTNYTLHGTKKPVLWFHFKKRKYDFFLVTLRIGVHRRIKVVGPATRRRSGGFCYTFMTEILDWDFFKVSKTIFLF